MNVVVTCRQSKNDEQGIDRQVEDCLALAAARSWRVIEIITDNEQSAKAAGRTKFARLLELLRSRTVQGVVGTEWSRMTRNGRDKLALIEMGRAVGATIALVRGSDLALGTAAGRLAAGVLAEAAQYEIDQKSERQLRANRQAAQQGRRVGGRRPFGYDPGGVTVRADEAQALADTYRAVLGGRSLARAASDLTAAGFVTPQPRRDGTPSPWTKTALRDLLMNPRNAGRRAVGTWREEIDMDGTVRKVGRRRWEVTSGQAVWPAIVDGAVFDRVHALLTAPGRATGMGPTRLLTGIAVCGACGGRVHAGGKAKGAPSGYRCVSGGCFSRRADPVDDYVSAVLAGYLSEPDARAVLAAVADPGGGADASSAAAAARARMEEFAADYGADRITRAAYLAGVEGARAALTAAERALASSAAGSALSALLAAGDMVALWDDADTDARRVIVRGLVTVTIDPPGRGRRGFDPATVKIGPRGTAT